MRATARVPATSANLGPGFDCLGLALDLHNTVTLDLASRPVQPLVEVRGEGHDRLPRNERNLALRSAQRVLRAGAHGLFVQRVVLDNTIPVGGGLGSSAAAIAGAMAAANAAVHPPFATDELLRVALEFEPHPDNLAAAFYGGFTVAVLGADGRPVVAALAPPPGLRAVVLTPDRGVSTHQSRAALPRAVAHADAAYTAGRAALLVAALLTGRHELLRRAMEDRLHQPYRVPEGSPQAAVMAAALEAGASGVALSGSGPSILALCAGPTAPVATAMRESAARSGLSARARELAIVAAGATVTALSGDW
jgi:homoserine kinase